MAGDTVIQTAETSGGTLIVGPSWVGDMVMAQTLFIALHKLYPDSPIDVLAPAWSAPILERMLEVRKAISLPFGHGEFSLFGRWKLSRTLSTGGYERAVVLPNSFKSALVPMFAGIPLRTGWRGEMRYGLLNDLRLLDKARYPLMIERFVALAYPDGAPLPNPLPRPALHSAAESAAKAMSSHNLSLERPVLALCPGAEFGPSKRWPSQRYGELAQVMIGRGWQVWLFGSANDVRVTDEIESVLAEADRSWCRSLAGKTSLGEAIDLLGLAGAVVSNDSGLMHIAAALNRPLVVVYGSTSPGFTPPLSDNAVIVAADVPCSPCFKRECPLTIESEKMRCMNRLTVDRVLAALDQLHLPTGGPVL
jgi:heptosyltransferase II